MTISWQFSPETTSDVTPAVHDQVFNVTGEVLSLRNPWVADSVFSGKLFTSTNLLMLAYLGKVLAGQTGYGVLFWTLVACTLGFILVSLALSGYRIFCIKHFSNFYFNRRLKRVYYRRNKTLIEFDWEQTQGGVFARTEFGGRSFSTSYALAFGPRPAADQDKGRIVLWVDSNNSIDPDPRYVAQVWEYIRQFMEEGPDRLPPPGEPNWWYAPLHRICMTPAEAWRHYAPWRTGEPGELQGKKSWLLPMWLVLFPYNLFSALCWYAVCRVFNVRGAPPPPEALGR